MSTPSLPQTPPGWYADPTNTNQVRYWDGSSWTTDPAQTYDAIASSMSFVDAVRSVLTKYADFSGRARRSEYWWFTLFTILAYIVAIVLDTAIGANGVLALVATLGFVVPGLAVTVRRLHDTNRSGWLVLISLIPFGSIVLLVFVCQDSDGGFNPYGNSPK